MAKSSRSILFVAAEARVASAAATAFTAVSGRLGLSWAVESVAVAAVNAERLAGYTVVAAVDAPEFAPPVGVRLERLSSTPELEQAVNALLARLLGGGEAPPANKPPPPPPAPKKVHTVKLSRETAGRKGKGVTVVSELPLGEEAIKELATLLKNKCGTGGTAKDGRIEIQGDHRDRLAVELEKLGYKVKRAGG
jgi:predicted translation initiation factor SUI1